MDRLGGLGGSPDGVRARPEGENARCMSDNGPSSSRLISEGEADTDRQCFAGTGMLLGVFGRERDDIKGVDGMDGIWPRDGGLV